MDTITTHEIELFEVQAASYYSLSQQKYALSSYRFLYILAVLEARDSIGRTVESICLYTTLRTTTSQPLLILLLRLIAPRLLSAISINLVSQGTSNQSYSMLTD